MTERFIIPTESAEQQALFQWVSLQSRRFPELSLLFHIPNGGARSKATAGRLKAEGVKKGVPDLCLPVSRGGYHGLYIELKRVKGGRVEPEQTEWMESLGRQGYQVAICRGAQSAVDTILNYLKEV